MKELGKEGILKVKENKGEFVVQGYVMACTIYAIMADAGKRYDAKHPSVTGHITHLTITEEETKAAKRAAREAASAEGEAVSGGGKGKGKELVIEEVWKPSGTSTSFWEAAGVE